MSFRACVFNIFFSLSSSGSGKSTWVMKCLDDPEYVFDTKFDVIIYVYAMYQPAFDKYRDRVRFFKGWDHDSLTIESLSKHSNLLVIADDVAGSHPDKTWEVSWMTRYSHHLPATYVLLVHSLYSKRIPFNRECSLNSTVTVLMLGKRTYSEIEIFARQLFKSNAGAFLDVYKKEVEGKGAYSYLVVDCDPRTYNFCKIKTRIFREESPMVIYVMRGDTVKV